MTHHAAPPKSGHVFFGFCASNVKSDCVRLTDAETSLLNRDYDKADFRQCDLSAMSDCLAVATLIEKNVLRHVDLEGTMMNHDGAFFILTAVQKCTGMMFLDLTNNNLTNGHLKRLNYVITQLRRDAISVNFIAGNPCSGVQRRLFGELIWMSFTDRGDYYAKHVNDSEEDQTTSSSIKWATGDLQLLPLGSSSPRS